MFSPTSLFFDQQLDIITSIASALSYLHSMHIIYRDLKPNNIGFSQDGRVQLFDFGLSRELPSPVMTEPFEMSGKVGTLRYMACEVATYQPYTVSADVYSWAMVAYETLTLQKPFQGWTRDMHSQLVCGQHVRPDVRLLTVNNDTTMLEIQPYIVAGWHAVPSRRPSMSVIAQHLQQLKALQQHHHHHHQPLLSTLRPQQQQQQASVVSVELPPDFGVRKAPTRSVSNSTKTTISTTTMTASSSCRDSQQLFG
jgi:serine/threonine protein kinase